MLSAALLQEDVLLIAAVLRPNLGRLKGCALSPKAAMGSD